MQLRYEEVERLIIGTVGLPGEREFFLQLTSGGAHRSFALEKGQASALSERMRELLREIKGRDLARYQLLQEVLKIDDDPLVSPVEAEFRIGEMTLLWRDDSERIILQAVSAEEAQSDSLEVAITVPQATEFIRRTERVVSAGRAPCPFCGLPLNIDGHLCPRANGYRR